MTQNNRTISWVFFGLKNTNREKVWPVDYRFKLALVNGFTSRQSTSLL